MIELALVCASPRESLARKTQKSVANLMSLQAYMTLSKAMKM